MGNRARLGAAARVSNKDTGPLAARGPAGSPPSPRSASGGAPLRQRRPGPDAPCQGPNAGTSCRGFATLARGEAGGRDRGRRGRSELRLSPAKDTAARHGALLLPPPCHGTMAVMRFLAKIFLRGLVAILPLALTGWLVYAAVAAGETLLRNLVLLVLPPDRYWPGMGFVLSVALVLVIGLLMYSFVVRRVYGRLVAMLERIPVVKSVYGMIVDVVRLFGSAEERPFRRVVLVTHDEGFEQIGFLTREDFDDLPGIGDGKVAVYLPMSYQLGGFTIVVPKGRVRELAMSVEDALRFCVTAGVARHGED